MVRSGEWSILSRYFVLILFFFFPFAKCIDTLLMLGNLFSTFSEILLWALKHVTSSQPSLGRHRYKASGMQVL